MVSDHRRLVQKLPSFDWPLNSVVDLKGKGGGSHKAGQVILLMVYTDINPAQSGPMESS